MTKESISHGNGVTASMTGVKEMVGKMVKVKDQLPKQVERGMYKEAQVEVKESKARTPVYVGPTGPGKPIPGLLKASVHSEGPFKKGTKLVIYIVAGGAAGAYAIPQHENPDYFHTIGQWKYIESVLNESRNHMLGRIGSHVDIRMIK